MFILFFDKESRSDGQRGGGRFGGRGTGRRGRGMFGRDSADNGNSYNNSGFSEGYRLPEQGDLEKSSERRTYGGPRGGGGAPRGGRRGGYNNGDVAEGERPRRVYERHSRTGRGLVFGYFYINLFFFLSLICSYWYMFSMVYSTFQYQLVFLYEEIFK